jgi:hypothetical protein
MKQTRRALYHSHPKSSSIPIGLNSVASQTTGFFLCIFKTVQRILVHFFWYISQHDQHFCLPLILCKWGLIKAIHFQSQLIWVQVAVPPWTLTYAALKIILIHSTVLGNVISKNVIIMLYWPIDIHIKFNLIISEKSLICTQVLVSKHTSTYCLFFELYNTECSFQHA